MMPTDQFIHLRVHSAYSLSHGAIKLKALIDHCQYYHMPAVAVTDINNLFGAMEFVLTATQAGIQPIIGCHLTVDLRPTTTESSSEKRRSTSDFLTLLVQTDKGYRNLIKLVSMVSLDPLGTPCVSLDSLADHTQGLIALTGGAFATVGRLLTEGQQNAAEHMLHQLQTLFPERLYIELTRHRDEQSDVGRIEANIEASLIDLAYRFDIPLVATNDCFFLEADMFDAHDALLCIGEGRYVLETNRRRVTRDHWVKSPQEMCTLFADLPEAIDNTLVIAQRCSFVLKAIDAILPTFSVQGQHSEAEELYLQATAGLNKRLEREILSNDMEEQEKSQRSKPYWQRLEYEYEVILGTGFAGYFLIVSDFMKWAQQHDIPVGIRGSGATSLIAWCLEITNIDPLRFNLVFERFLNPQRVSIPDFDIDFCRERRDEVIDYVANKYGHDRIAHIITFSTFQLRVVVRDVGRVLQMPHGLIEDLCKQLPESSIHPPSLQEVLDRTPLLQQQQQNDPNVARLLSLAIKLEGLYRNISTHAAGIVIGNHPLEERIPLYRDASSKIPITQFDMKSVEKCGLVKFDFLGLKTLSLIGRIEYLIRQEDPTFDRRSISLEDVKTYQMLGSGETVGIFQLESVGMRDLLRQMQPDRIDDLIALLALYRPGPIENIPRYIACKHGRERPKYLHPKLKPILSETFGVMTYQEDVMRIARDLAGYTMGQADMLRRAMGKKIQAEMDNHKVHFIDGCIKNGLPSQKAEQIFEVAAKFANYGFNKGHAVAYAILSYQMAYLKTNYTVAFMAASMTLDIGRIDKITLACQELTRLNIPLLPPDINHSYTEFTIEHLASGKKTIRYALTAIKGVGQSAMESLVAERTLNGVFVSLDDFAHRIDARVIPKGQLETLSAAGAFDSLLDNRAQVFHAIHHMYYLAQATTSDRHSGQVSLFDMTTATVSDTLTLPEVLDWDPLEKFKRAFEALGLCLMSSHPLETYTETLQQRNIVRFTELQHQIRHNDKGYLHHVRMAGILVNQRVRLTKKGQHYTLLTLSDSSGCFEVMVLPKIVTKSQTLLTPWSMLSVVVEARLKSEELRLTCQEISRLDAKRVTGTSVTGTAEEHFWIRLRDVKAVLVLREFVDRLTHGHSRLWVVVEMTPNRIEIELPGRYDLSSAMRTVLQRLPGVVVMDSGTYSGKESNVSHEVC